MSLLQLWKNIPGKKKYIKEEKERNKKNTKIHEFLLKWWDFAVIFFPLCVHIEVFAKLSFYVLGCKELILVWFGLILRKNNYFPWNAEGMYKKYIDIKGQLRQLLL